MSLPQAVIAVRAATRNFRVGLGFRKRRALHELSLELANGESLALVGPNGSGKSTLLRMLAGIDQPSTGEVQVFGNHPASQAVRQRIGWCPENAPFPGELNGLRALRLLAALAGLERNVISAGAPAMITRVGLDGAQGQALRTYSRGMLRRFALAQAFLGSPSLVLLDEPTAGLDGPGFQVLESLLNEHRQAGGSLVLASHLISDIHDHCDDMAVLVAGQLVGHGKAADLLAGEGQRLEVDGLDPDALQRLGAWVANEGGQVLSLEPRSRALADLYQSRPVQ